ncbi:MAG TPA: PQQ-binding-like beta-propeller repeat protein [Vicinamibacterales bacterium]|nr:PQQ-binding-like beta-propeller repeat protein [Vicinamibacterales bacterium]
MRPKLLAVCLLLCATLPLAAQSGAKNGEWRAYGAEPGSTKYSPLDQINKDNAKTLRIAWRFRTDNLGPRADFNMEATPIMVNGVLYSQAGARRNVVALDPTTGEQLWMWRMDEGKRGANAPRQGSGRGVAYWTDGRGDERIYTVTPGYQLVALNAKTGLPIPGFGTRGVVDLKQNDDQVMDLETADIGLNSGPVVGNNTIVVGAAHLPGGAPKAKENVKGYVRGFDVRTGKRLWIFHTIPQPGEPGNETWENDSWSYTGNAGNWAPITIDEALNRVYLTIESGTGDYYGGHRPGANLFTDSIVSLDLTTGKRFWYFQMVHHDIWDWDVPNPPILMDITVNGKAIKAVAVPSKQAYLYTFDRVTGEPVWPIVETPVPKGTVPGEYYAPTQPIPTKPAPYDRQGFREEDLLDWTPEIKAEALRVLNLHKWGPTPWEPPAVRGEDGKAGSLQMPGNNGGSNWEGGCFDPETGMIYIFSSTQYNRRSLSHDPARSNMNYIDGGGGEAAGPGGAAPPPDAAAGAARGGAGAAGAAGAAGGRGGRGGGAGQVPTTAFGLQIVKPPYGRITAINMNTGEHVWMQPVGNTPDTIKNHPMLQGVTIPKTGRPGRVGTMVTKTLVWAGERGPLETVNGQQVSWFRGYDKMTGEIASEVQIPANVTNIPMTYMAGGKQYIVIAVAAPGRPAELLALALP